MNIKIDYYKYTIEKVVNDLNRLNRFILLENSIIKKPSHIDRIDNNIIFNFENELSSSEIETLNNFVQNYTDDPIIVVRNIVDSTIAFGNELIKEFITDNILLGINQLNLVTHVRKTTSELIQCLQIGTLYDGIDELKKINPNDFDEVILTPERLLIFRNKVHSYLNIPPANTWNE